MGTTNRKRSFALASTILCGPILCGAIPGLSGTAAAQSDPVASFYAGRTVQAVVGYTPGSTFELYLRTAVRHMGRHIPGNPNIIVQHMPGAGSLKATGYLANVAPKDGSVIGMPNPVNTVEPLIDPERTKFDPRKFNWLGSLNTEISTCGFWAKDLKTLDDLKRREISVGSTGPSSGSTVDALVLKALVGINFKVVSGYPGLTEVRLAAERGEVDGHCGFLVSSIKTDAWDAFKTGKFSVPIQMGLTKHSEISNVPNAYDLAASDEDKQLFKLIFGPWAYGRPIMAPPGTPTDRVAALRRAFKDLVNDKQFLDEAKKLNIEIQPVEPGTIEKLVDEIFRTPPAVIERARVLLGASNR